MRSRVLVVFIGLLCVAAMLYFPMAQALDLSWIAYWTSALVVAVAAAILAAMGGREPSLTGSSGEFLCDNCRYNSARDCSRPERPNAVSCPDYKGR
jgi:hypothetical protein